jgi:ribosome modulation factor
MVENKPITDTTTKWDKMEVEEQKISLNSKEYAIGYAARKGRLEITDNPFKETQARIRWRQGWNDADFDTRL